MLIRVKRRPNDQVIILIPVQIHGTHGLAEPSPEPHPIIFTVQGDAALGEDNPVVCQPDADVLKAVEAEVDTAPQAVGLGRPDGVVVFALEDA